MEIIRGIVTTIYNKNNSFMAVESVQHCHELNKICFPVYIKTEDRVLGTIIDEKFNICFDISLKNGQTVFGTFLFKSKNGKIKIQLVNDFNRMTYYPYETFYQKGKILAVIESDIISVSV